MTSTPQLRVIFFDVFGTCVAQQPPVADELSSAAQAALESGTSSLSGEVRSKAEQTSYEDWFELGREWNREEGVYVKDYIGREDTVDWEAVDKHRIETLPKLLERRGLVTVYADDDASGPKVVEGSLFDEAQLNHLGCVWHRLPPWSDTCRGLDLLNTKFSTVALSNTYQDLIERLAAHSSIPFTHKWSAELFGSYKPNPKVYLGAAEKMGVKPEECALVAAHLGDLKGAKACGFYTIYVERPLEEKNPELREENIPHITIKEDEQGLITVAQRLGISSD